MTNSDTWKEKKVKEMHGSFIRQIEKDSKRVWTRALQATRFLALVLLSLTLCLSHDKIE